MCQLLGVSSNQKVNIDFSLREFRHRGTGNPHGWGFASWEKEQWRLEKAPGSLAEERIEEENFSFLSRIIIGHVREKSCGDQSHENTHPFVIGNWAFAHNGTVTSIVNSPEFRLSKYRPRGDTDSEYAFCFLMEKIGEETAVGKISDIISRVAENVRRVAVHGEFNFLISNGEYLFAYGDDSLHYVERKAPFAEVTLRDENYTIDLNEIKTPGEKAVLVATEPLTKNEDWKRIEGLKVFRNGEVVS